MNKLVLEYTNIVVKWLNEREDRERVGILVLACVSFAMLWYFFLQKPLLIKRMQIQQQTASVHKQTTFLNNESSNIVAQAAKNASQKKQVDSANQELQTLNIHFASRQGTNELLKAILNPVNSIRIMDLKNIVNITKPALTKPDATKVAAPEMDSYQVTFQSDYFNTLTYLESLEKLPWCLSWDSLEYTVMSYPNAQVAITLHIVSA